MRGPRDHDHRHVHDHHDHDRDHDPEFRGRGWGGPRRRRRGDIRTAVLAVLAERPGHGYEVMQTLEERTGGAWRPSPGSVYPTLQLLEDEGLVRVQVQDGRKVYELTDSGRAEAAQRAEQAGGPPWAAEGRDPGLRRELAQLAAAVAQVARAGDDERRERAAAILKDARRQLYQLLAES
jgi:DNA-binding PadR family transcriptional regulator